MSSADEIRAPAPFAVGTGRVDVARATAHAGHRDRQRLGVPAVAEPG